MCVKASQTVREFRRFMVDIPFKQFYLISRNA